METPIIIGTPSYFEDVTAKMQQYDMGLLAKTTRKFLVSDKITLEPNNRIRFNNENMQVDSIAVSNFPGLLWVQCSKDMRVTK